MFREPITNTYFENIQEDWPEGYCLEVIKRSEISEDVDEAIRILARTYEGYIRKFANKYNWMVNDYDVLVSVGIQGIYRAAQLYDPEQGTFSTYVYTAVRRYIQDTAVKVRYGVTASRTDYAHYRRFQMVEDYLTQENKVAPTFDQTFKLFNQQQSSLKEPASPEKIMRFLNADRHVVEIDDREEDAGDWEEILSYLAYEYGDPKISSGRNTPFQRLYELLNLWKSKNIITENERLVVMLRCYTGRKFREIAKILGYEDRRGSAKAWYKAVDVLREHPNSLDALKDLAEAEA